MNSTTTNNNNHEREREREAEEIEEEEEEDFNFADWRRLSSAHVEDEIEHGAVAVEIEHEIFLTSRQGSSTSCNNSFTSASSSSVGHHNIHHKKQEHDVEEKDEEEEEEEKKEENHEKQKEQEDGGENKEPASFKERCTLYFKFVILALAATSEGLGVQSLIPLVGNLLAFLTGCRLEETGEVSGFLVAFFFVGQTLSGPFFGKLSDRFGRRPLILLGLCASAIAQISFGLSGSLLQLFVTRFFHGAFNGVIINVKSAVAEISTKETEAFAFSLLSLSWGLGSILGLSIGGEFYDVVRVHGWFQDGPDWLRELLLACPALAANFVCSCYAILTAIFIFFFLEETNAKVVKARKEEMLKRRKNDPASVSSSCCSWCPSFRSCCCCCCCSFFGKPKGAQRLETQDQEEQGDDDEVEMSSKKIEEEEEGEKSSTGEKREQEKETQEEERKQEERKEEEEQFGIRDALKIPGLRLAIISYMIHAAQDIAVQEVFPLLAIQNTTIGGFGLTVAQVGNVNSVSGCGTILSNFVFPPVWHRLGTSVFGVSTLIVGVLQFFIPFLKVLNGTSYLVPCLMALLLARQLPCSFAYTSSNIGVKTAAPRKFLGQAIGFAQSGASSMRLISPPLFAPLFSLTATTKYPLGLLGIDRKTNIGTVFYITSGLAIFSGFYSFSALGVCCFAKKDSADNNDGSKGGFQTLSTSEDVVTSSSGQQAQEQKQEQSQNQQNKEERDEHDDEEDSVELVNSSNNNNNNNKEVILAPWEEDES